MVTVEDNFKKNPARTEPGRMQRKLEGDACKEAKAWFDRLLPEKWLIPNEKVTAAMAASMVLTAFAIAKNRVTSTAEFSHVAVFRLGIKGNRTIICAPTLAVVKYLKAKARDASAAATTVDTARAYHWLKTATVVAAKAYKEADVNNLMAYGTVGPHDVVYLPSGWMFYERIQGKDFSGIRRQILSLQDQQLLGEMNDYFVGAGMPNAALLKTVDCLAMAE